MQVLKYRLPEPREKREFTLDLPEFALIVSAHLQHQTPVIWAYVDVGNPLRAIRFWWIEDGEETPDGCQYQETLHFFNGNEVFHLFSHCQERRTREGQCS